ncbi:T9SS type A sorting domain-containing protein [candidate division TA06 bacterium]|nr:T9SS type A sorting domain-containing protein [candidate division TA06 bacterium]
MKRRIFPKSIGKTISPSAVILAALLILGVSTAMADSLNVRTIGYYDLPSLAWNSCIVGDLLYVADHDMGLRVLDVSDPANPAEIVKFMTSLAQDVAVRGGLAYVADGDQGLRIIDLNDYYDPQEIGYYDTDNYALSVVLSGNYAYVADLSSLQIIDISDSTNPCLAGSISCSGYTWWVVVKDNYAYLANGSGGLIAVDVTNPALPVMAGYYNTNGEAYYVCVDDSFAFVADGPKGLKIVNIARPDSMYLVGTYAVSIDENYGVKSLGNTVYLADCVYGLIVLDVSNPALPVNIGHYKSTEGWMTLTIDDEYIYMNNAGAAPGIKIFEYYGSSGITEEYNGNCSREKSPRIYNIGPNPFKSKTTWRVQTARTEAINIQIYDVSGKRIKTISYKPQNTGSHTISWDGCGNRGRKVPNGVYFYSVLIDEKKYCGKITVLK